MKHYPHHIGDFDKATRHCTRIERSVYRDLMDLYYDTECQLILDQAELCRKIIARSNEESTAVQRVLNEFFTETPTGWYHVRCEEEISKYHANTSQKAQAGKASAAAKAQKRQRALNGISTDVERTNNGTSTNHQPINQSTNQPKNTEPAKRATTTPVIARPDDVDPQTWADWCQLRKAKRATVSVTVIDGARSEAAKAGMSLEEFLQVWCRRGSQGLEAAWLKPDERKQPHHPKTFAERDREAGMARWEEQTGRIHPDRIKGQQNEFRETMGQVIDLTPKTLEIEQ